MKFLKQSTQTIVPMGPFLLPTDGVTLVTSLVSALDHATTGIFLIKNGGSGAIRHQAIAAATVYDSYGMYLVTLDQTDTGTLGRLRVYFAAAASCLPVWEDFQVLPATMFDSLVTGSGGAIPAAVAGANGGLPTQNGTKLNQTVDLTASQSIACSDKTGFSLSATGADLILKTSTFVAAIVAALNELATYGLTALNGLLVTTGIKAATIPAATLANGAHGGTATVITLQTPIEANVASEADHDFTALQKTALNAATPASVQNIPATGSGFTALGDTRIANLNATISSRSSHSAADVWAVTVRSLSTFGTLVADIATAVWGAVTRILTAGTNIVLAKGTGVTGLNDLSGGDVRTAVGLASANLDTQLAALPTDSDITAAVPTANGIADQVWNEAIAGHVAVGSTGAKLNGVGPGVGAITWEYTLTNSLTGLPIFDADVWVTTDALGADVIAYGKTNAMGVVTFYLDAGDYFVWRQKSGWDFVNPDSETVTP